MSAELSGRDLVCGGDGADRLRGGTGQDRMFGGGDSVIPDEPPLRIGDTFIGGPGNDYFDGAEFEGPDVANYEGADFRVVADLATGEIHSGGSTDRVALDSIETVVGSTHDDRLLGSSDNDDLTGGLGDDEVTDWNLEEGGTIDGGTGTDDLTLFFYDDGEELGLTLDLGAGQLTAPVNATVVSYESVSGSEATDTIYGSTADESFFTFGGDDAIYTYGGDDEIDGGTGEDTAAAGPGNDTCVGVEHPSGQPIAVPRWSLGSDIAHSTEEPRVHTQRFIATIGAAGFVLSTIVALWPATGSYAQAPASCRGKPATVTGTNGDDHLVGTRTRDVIVARDGADAIDGRGGKDLICAGSGWDVVKGGPGADRIFGAKGADTLNGNSGQDRVYGQRDGVIECDGGCIFEGDTLVGSPGTDRLDGGDHREWDTIDYSRSAHRVLVDAAEHTVTSGRSTDRVVGNDLIVGSRFADRMVGSTRSDRFDGGPGADTVLGRGGADGTLRGGDGSDVIRGGPGSDGASGNAGADTIYGGPDGDQLVLSDGADQMFAGPGDDTIYESHAVGTHRVQGGEGSDNFSFFDPDEGDRIDGGDGRDRLGFDYDLGDITLDLAAGTLTAPVQADVSSFEIVNTYYGSDTLYGSDADEEFRTYAGDDTIEARGGDDYIDGLSGTDTADGGPGSDSCVGIENATNCERP